MLANEETEAANAGNNDSHSEVFSKAKQAVFLSSLALRFSTTRQLKFVDP